MNVALTEKGLAATLQAALLPKHDAAGPGASDLGNGQRLARQPLGLATLHLKEASFICEKKKPFMRLSVQPHAGPRPLPTTAVEQMSLRSLSYQYF